MTVKEFANKLPRGEGDGTYCYRLRCPMTKRIRYYGTTYFPRQRFAAHCLSPQPSTKKWIESLRLQGLFPSMEIVIGPAETRLAVLAENGLIIKTKAFQKSHHLLNRIPNPGRKPWRLKNQSMTEDDRRRHIRRIIYKLAKCGTAIRSPHLISGQ